MDRTLCIRCGLWVHMVEKGHRLHFEAMPLLLIAAV